LRFRVPMRDTKETPMKAVVCTRYGPPEVLQLKDVAKPIPLDNEVCIHVHATAVTASDIFIRGSQLPIRYLIPMRLMLGLTRPRQSVIGLVLAGEIESTGGNVERFKIGDQVYGLTGFGLGAYAEYKCMQETDSTRGCLALKPTNLTYEEATMAAYGGLLALQYIEKGNVKPGQKVLVYGASGTTGTIAVQFAKYIGAEVTGVCSTRNLELVKSLGADRLIDYTKEDHLNPGERFDLVLDAVGKRKTSRLKRECKKALAPGGAYVSIDDGNLMLDSKRLNSIRELVEAGQVRPVIDRCYPLEEIVEAHRYVGKGHKRGGVPITVGPGGLA
jgi:NADPH:quinone reductase-like Zn-dependent oxidoreductase